MRTYSLKQFGTSLSYKRIEKLGDRLEPISNLINWEEFRKFFNEEDNKVGRPNYDPILMIKMLIIQSWYGISDEELEYQVADRISFQKFLGFPNEIPDYSTVWRFREALAEDKIIDEMWAELHKQMEEHGIKTSNGVMQDAAFVVAPPGKTNSGMKDRGRDQPSTRNEDGSWSKKGDKSYFGYKKHIKTCLKTGIIKEVAVTTARTADCSLDLTKPDEKAIKKADNIMLATEGRDLLGNTEGWDLPEPPLETHLTAISIGEARSKFLRLFHKLSS
mgnify:CR=1 FL=1